MEYKSQFPKVIMGVPALRSAANVVLRKGSECSHAGTSRLCLPLTVAAGAGGAGRSGPRDADDPGYEVYGALRLLQSHVINRTSF